MNLLGNLVERGGPVMYVIMLLAVLLSPWASSLAGGRGKGRAIV